MGVLLDKEPVENTIPEDDSVKPFILYLEKYKSVVSVSSVKVSETDDSMLEIEFDHSISAPIEEINEEVGRLIIRKLENGIASLEKSSLFVSQDGGNDEKTDSEPVPMPEV